MEPAITLTATSEEMAAILSLAAATENIEEISEPSALSAAEALNAGLATDLETVLQVVTIIFKTGAALLTFLTALRAEIRSRQAARISVSDPVNGKPLGQISAASSDAALERLVPP